MLRERASVYEKKTVCRSTANKLISWIGPNYIWWTCFERERVALWSENEKLRGATLSCQRCEKLLEMGSGWGREKNIHTHKKQLEIRLSSSMCKPFYHFRIVRIISFSPKQSRAERESGRVSGSAAAKCAITETFAKEWNVTVRICDGISAVAMGRCEQRTESDDSSAPNVLYHFSIPFSLTLDIFSMQTQPTIHLAVIVFLLENPLFDAILPFFSIFNPEYILHANTAAVAIVIIVLFVSVFIRSLFFVCSPFFAKFTCVSISGTAV